MSGHEFIEGFCKWCGAMPPGSNNTCLERAEIKSDLRPEPARRELTFEDYDTIGRQLGKPAAERTAAMNEPSKD